MLCNNFECVCLIGDECNEMGGECIQDICENWGECINCQKQAGPDDCWKDEGSRSRSAGARQKLSGSIPDM